MMSRKRPLFTLVLVVAVLSTAPFLLPSSLLAPMIERMVSEPLGEDVHVGGVRLFILPVPHVTVTDATVGSAPFLQIEKLAIVPDLFSLFSEEKVIRSVRLNGVKAYQPLLSRIDGWATGASEKEKPGATMRVKRVELRGADLLLQTWQLKSVDVDVELDPDNSLVSASVLVGGGRVKMTLTPEHGRFAVRLSARDWRLPVGPPLHISLLDANGVLSQKGLELSTVNGRLYRGEFAGKTSLTWKPLWRLAGTVELKNVDVQPVASIYTKDKAITGRLNAVSRFDMQAVDATGLLAAPDVAVDFEVHDGTLHKLDLASAATLLPTAGANKARETKFNRFSGQLAYDATGLHFTDLNIASGVLSGTGDVSISPARKLSGRIEVALKGTGSFVGTPLAVSGTVEAPMVLPTRGTLAGAAAGTILLGPGVGTTLGMKAAQITERLFARKTGKNKTQEGTGKAGAESEKKTAVPMGGR